MRDEGGVKEYHTSYFLPPTSSLTKGTVTMKTVTIYTDGACSGNPGPGGWGAILKYGDAEKELSGGAPETTNTAWSCSA